jgi:hypothetical protein
MSNSGTIIHILPNKVPPKEDLLAVKRVFPTVHGFCLQWEGRLEYEKHARDVPIDELMKAIEVSKAEHRFLFFGNFSSYENEDDIQPFIINMQEQPVLAILFEGNFKKWDGLNGKHTAEFNNADENLFPRIGRAMEEADGDFDKLIQILRNSESVKKVFTNTFTDRGWFQFIPYKGQPFGFGNNQASGFDWGTVSNVENVTFPKKTETPTASEKKSGGVLSFMGSTKSVEKATEPTKTDTAVTDVPVGFTMVSVPSVLDESARNAWIRLFYGANAQALIGEGNGELPAAHKSAALQIPVANIILDYTKDKVSNHKEVRKLQERLIHLANKRKMSGTVDPDKKVEGTREPASNYIPTMNEAEVADQMDKWLKYLDAKSEKRPSPLEIQKMESQHPTYSEKVGIKFANTLFAPVHHLMDLWGSKPAVIAYIELRRKYLNESGVKLEDLIKTLDPEVGKSKEEQVTVSPTQSGDTTTTAPTKKSGALSFMKSA